MTARDFVVYSVETKFNPCVIMVNMAIDKPVKTKYQVKVINDKCIGAASCVALAMQTFKLNEMKIAEIIDQDGNLDDEKLLAAQSCPTSAIEVIDVSTGTKVWPQ